MGPERLRELDGRLARLARLEGVVRFAMGRVLSRMAERSLHHELGFSSIGAYVVERAARSARWGNESCLMARRLAELPVLGAALGGGQLGWSMAELLARYATPSDEAALVRAARGSTVRQMRMRLAEARARARAAEVVGPHDVVAEEEAELSARIGVTLSSEQAWLLEYARAMFMRTYGRTQLDDFVHWMVAEGVTSLREMVPRSVVAEFQARVDESGSRAAAWRRQLETWRREAEGRVEPGLSLGCEIEVGADFVDERRLEAGTARELDGLVRELSAQLAGRDLLLGALAEEFWRADGWRRLGFASERQYASERLGVSLSSLKTKRSLSRRSGQLPAVAAALERREIGFEAALLVARVATSRTVRAWLSRARERTVKHLREEVDAAELAVRHGGGRDQLPPDEASLKEVARRVRAAGRVVAGAAGSAAEELFTTRVRGVLGAIGELGQLSVRPRGRERVREAALGAERGRGRVKYSFAVGEDTRALWGEFLEWFDAAREWLPGGTTPMAFLCTCFCLELTSTLPQDVAYAHIYERDGWVCQSPVCNGRCLNPHHLVFRSLGGSDDEENLISLCVWCHLFGVHGGLIRAAAPASRVRWELGREGLIVVEGRRKLAAG